MLIPYTVNKRTLAVCCSYLRHFTVVRSSSSVEIKPAGSGSCLFAGSFCQQGDEHALF